MDFSTYDGLVINNNAKQESFYKQTYYTSNSLSISQNDTLIWRLFYLSSTKLLTIERSYSTLIEVVGIVGGISKFLILLGFILTRRYNNLVLVWKLANEIYDFDSRKRYKTLTVAFPSPRRDSMLSSPQIPSPSGMLGEHQNFSQRDVKNFEILQTQANELLEGCDIVLERNDIECRNINQEINIFNVNPIEGDNIKRHENNLNNINPTDSDKIKQQENKEFFTNDIENLIKVELTENKNWNNNEKILESKKNAFHLTSLDFLLSVFLPQFLRPKKLRDKTVILDKAEANLNRYLDIYQMIRRFQEVENLKIVLLNKRQRSLFSNISKPNLAVNYPQTISSQPPELSQEEIIETLKSKENGNHIDSQLLEMLNEEMKEKIFMQMKNKL